MKNNNYLIGIILLFILSSFIFITYISFPEIYSYDNNLFIKLSNINTRSGSKNFELRVAKDKNFINCNQIEHKEINGRYCNTTCFADRGPCDTCSTYHEIENKCVLIFGNGSGIDILNLKKKLKENSKYLIIH